MGESKQRATKRTKLLRRPCPQTDILTLMMQVSLYVPRVIGAVVARNRLTVRVRVPSLVG